MEEIDICLCSVKNVTATIFHLYVENSFLQFFEELEYDVQKVFSKKYTLEHITPQGLGNFIKEYP